MKIFLHAAALAALLFSTSCASWSDNSAEEMRTRKVLVFTKSSGFEHSAIKQVNGQPSYIEPILRKMGLLNNIEFTFTKDGSVFTPEGIAKYDAFLFYTTGDLSEPGTDKNPPMPRGGKEAFLNAIKNGKGFIGLHSATDTFHSPGGKEHGPARFQDDGVKTDPYIRMIGAEFIQHGSQQKSRIICTDANFPGMEAVAPDFGPLEEWYSLKDFAPDLHVLLVQDTTTMKQTENMYRRAPYPETWVHKYGKGRVFYSSMGHRDDVLTNPTFQSVLLGGLKWATGQVNADISPNLATAAPGASQLPPYEAPKPAAPRAPRTPAPAPKPTATN